jgi:hypothetical protein
MEFSADIASNNLDALSSPILEFMRVSLVVAIYWDELSLDG